ncbi:MAG: hypothetical protein R3B09_01130 [Nannocystaceae bacterium]
MFHADPVITPSFSKLARALVALVLALPAAACDGDEGGHESSEGPPACLYNDFDVTLESGPSAPLKLIGDLVLNRVDGSSEIEGTYLTKAEDGADAMLISVAGNTDDASISLTFTLPDGGVIEGTGALAAPFDSCPAPMEGTAMGPQAGDVGHWLGAASDPLQPSGKGSYKGGTCYCSFSSKTACMNAGGTGAFCCACCGLGL